MFVGRDRELEYLEKEMRAEGFRMFVLYGRRRVGKTELLKQFVKDKRAVRLTGISGDLSMNVSRFAERIPSQYLTKRINPDFEDILDSVVKMSKDGRTVLVIDEFPYLANSDRSIASRLQTYIDDVMKEEDIFLILCGSSIGSMKEGVLGAKSPLYGRRTGQMELTQFDFRTASLMLKDFSVLDRFRIYSVVGGIPMYLLLFDASRTFEENISELFLKGTSVLSVETEMILREEMKTPSSYSSLLTTMASGKSRVSEISDRTGGDLSVTSNQLSNLSYIHIVEKVQPFRDGSVKKTRYRICDNLFRFHYGFLHGRETTMDDDESMAAARRICGEMNDFLGISFEQVCRQHCRSLGWNSVGTWWGADSTSKTTEEIDIVADNIDAKPGITLFCECKYDSKRINSGTAKELVRKSMLVPCEKREYLLFYAVGESPSDTDGMKAVSLDQMC